MLISIGRLLSDILREKSTRHKVEFVDGLFKEWVDLLTCWLVTCWPVHFITSSWTEQIWKIGNEISSREDGRATEVEADMKLLLGQHEEERGRNGGVKEGESKRGGGQRRVLRNTTPLRNQRRFTQRRGGGKRTKRISLSVDCLTISDQMDHPQVFPLWRRWEQQSKTVPYWRRARNSW